MIQERFQATIQMFRLALIALKAISKPTPFTWTPSKPVVWAAIWLCAAGSPPGALQPATSIVRQIHLAGYTPAHFTAVGANAQGRNAAFPSLRPVPADQC